MQKVVVQDTVATNTTTQLTKTLLACGAVAGPIFTVLGLAQAFTRPGFDVTRYTLSLLSLGDLGWIQVANFVLSGLLFLLGAVGIRQVLKGSRGGTWGPLLIGLCGLGMIGAGFFTADAGLGFPPGTPNTVPTGLSWHGGVHMLMGSLSFLSMMVACFVFTRRFVESKERGWATYTAISGVLFVIGFGGLMSGQSVMTSVFVFTALNAYVCLSLMAAKVYGALK